MCKCKWFFASWYYMYLLLLLRVVLVFFASSQAFFFFLSLLYFAVSFFLLRMVLVRAEVMSAGAKTGPARRTVAGTFFRVLGYSSYLGTAYSSTASTRKNHVFAYFLKPWSCLFSHLCLSSVILLCIDVLCCSSVPSDERCYSRG